MSLVVQTQIDLKESNAVRIKLTKGRSKASADKKRKRVAAVTIVFEDSSDATDEESDDEDVPANIQASLAAVRTLRALGAKPVNVFADVNK
jgi:hypothetical protein